MDPYLGIYSAGRLQSLGLSNRDVGRAVAEGRLERIHRGWFKAPDAVPDAVTAVRLGGVLTATSGSRHAGLWTLADERIHVLVPRHASRLRLRDAEAGSDRRVCVHWSKVALKREIPVAEPMQLVLDSHHCQSRPTTVALADSALNRGLLRFEVLEAALPRLAPWCDPASQSGTESIVRIGLRQRGVKLRIQVPVEGGGYVDLVVGDRLVIECDSAAYHEGYQSERDYERDQELLRLGYLVLRLKYRHVVHEWDRIEALVLDVVRARRHRWRVGGQGTVLAL
ncbi:MAG: endonuclease domain-containing protein [Marmoricola sp.]